MSLEKMYHEEIANEIEELGSIELGSDKYDTTVDGVTRLTDRLVKLKELEIEQHKTEIEWKKVEIEKQQIEEERKDRRVKNGISLTSVVLPAVVTTIGTGLLFIFETRGSVTSRFGNKILDRMFRTK